MGNLKQQSITMRNALSEVPRYRPEMVEMTQPDGETFRRAVMLPDPRGEWVKRADVRERFNVECEMMDMHGIETR
jgi:hypothetical protein